MRMRMWMWMRMKSNLGTTNTMLPEHLNLVALNSWKRWRDENRKEGAYLNEFVKRFGSNFSVWSSLLADKV